MGTCGDWGRMALPGGPPGARNLEIAIIAKTQEPNPRPSMARVKCNKKDQMASTTPSHQPNPTLFFDTVQGYQRAYALKAAVDLDLFTAIAGGSATAEEITRACKAPVRGTRILADYMTVAGFLVKS